MLKKLVKTGAVLSLVVSAAAFAGGPDNMAMASAPCASHNDTGFFLGGAIGMGTVVSNVTASTIGATGYAGQSYFLGGLLGGYQAVFSNDLYAAIVGNALFNSLSTKLTTVGTAYSKVRNEFQGGLAVRFGKRFENAIPYVDLGAQAGSWKYQAVPASGVATSQTKTLIGPQAGLGILFDITNNWNAGLEADYTWFGKMSNGGNNVKTDQTQVLASVSYLFN